MKKILEFIKKLFIQNKPITTSSPIKETKKESGINKIEIGNIIIAKRYDNEEEKKQITSNHREGPFIVLEKTEDGLVCSKGTGVFKNGFYKIEKGNYTLTKDTYFNLYDFKIITPYHFKKYVSSIDNDELSMFYEVCKKNNKTYKYERNDITIKFPYQSSDIVLYNNKKYLIVDINDKLKLLKINNTNNLTVSDLDKLDYSKIIEIDLDSNITYLSKLDSKLFKHLLINLRKYIEYLNKKTKLQRGSIIKFDNNLYCVNHIENGKLHVFKIKPKKEFDYHKINLNGKSIYINYIINVIDQTNKIEIIDLLDEKEMSEISKRKKEISLKIKNNKFCVGTIIKNKNYKNKHYIVKGKNNNKLICVDIDELKHAKNITVAIEYKDAIIDGNVDLNNVIYMKENPDFELKDINKKMQEIIKMQEEHLNKNSIKNDQYLFGDIIIEENGFVEYIVIDVNDNNVSCISYKSIKEDFPNIKTFNINDITKAGELSINELKQIKRKFSLTIKSAKKKV